MFFFHPVIDRLIPFNYFTFVIIPLLEKPTEIVNIVLVELKIFLKSF